MKGKWGQMVYIDLFAGAGHARIIETGRTYLSSALIAMSIPVKFSKYILCEEDPERFKALKSRVDKDFSHLNVALINGDSNKTVNHVLSEIPPFSKKNTLLPFCFVDPFSLNLHFNTIEQLGGKRLMDFLILQALHMDANRNLSKYIKEENDKIALYLGYSEWRKKFNESCRSNSSNFVRFLAEQYMIKMRSIGYVPESNMHQIRSNEKNLPLYYLAFYSKHPRGIDFYKRVEKYSNPQLRMEF